VEQSRLLSDFHFMQRITALKPMGAERTIRIPPLRISLSLTVSMPAYTHTNPATRNNTEKIRLDMMMHVALLIPGIAIVFILLSPFFYFLA